MKVNLLIVKCMMILIIIFVIVSTVRSDWQKDLSFAQQDVTDVEVIGTWLYFSSADTVYRMSDQFNSTVKMGTVDKGIVISQIFDTGSKLIVGTYNGGVFESLDGGYLWVKRNTGLSGVGSNSILAIASRGDSLYIGTGGAGVFVSSLTEEMSWQPFNDGLPWNSAWEIYSLYNWKDMLFTGAGLSGYVYRNHRDSSIWNYSQFNDNVGIGLAMLDIFMTETGILVGLGSNGIYYSHDIGLNWKFAAAPFTAASNGKVLSISGRIIAIFSHTTMGIYIYEWISDDWVLIDNQVGLVAYDFDYFNDKIYAACWDGLWFYPLNPTGIDPQEPTIPNNPHLSQNYPNPFNPSTTIEYNLPRRSNVQIVILNLLGEKVLSLINQEKPAGVYTITWDGTTENGERAASGFYFYRIITDDFIETKKMLLLK